MARVSVVICAYTDERWDDLVAAVDSVDRQTTSALETIVVVDHNPALLDRVRAGLPGVVAVENGEASGLSGARNSGIAASAGDVVAFLDDDAVAAEDWLEHIVRSYREPDVVGVGGAVEPLWVGGERRSFPDEFRWVVGCTYRGMPEQTSRVRNAIGANMSFRREIFDAIGGFRSGIGRVGTRPVGCEETELSIRVRQRYPSAVVLYEPRARVRHRVPASRTRFSYFLSRCYAEGLSKALVTRLAGARDGLSSERSYMLRTLPRGVANGLRDAVLGRDGHGLARAAWIVAGLATTTCGYAIGRLRGATTERTTFRPGSSAPAPESVHA
ncbi:MAG: glycosyltransferase [Actinomycetota bacterium]|nr:glycosyltransferase [Actinomycetota bacterium]